MDHGAFSVATLPVFPLSSLSLNINMSFPRPASHEHPPYIPKLKDVRASSYMDVVVESLAQRLAWYLQVHAQETDLLRADPSLRDRVKAEIDRRAPQATAAMAGLSSGEELDACLEAIDTAVATEPTSFEEYALCSLSCSCSFKSNVCA